MIYPDEHMLYAPVEWQDCSEGYTDIRYHKSADGIAKITINRPQVRNAFRPLTVKEMIQALADARYDDTVGVIILTGEGTILAPVEEKGDMCKFFRLRTVELGLTGL